MTAASKERLLGFSSCALASTLWGTGFFFGKISLREMNVGAMVFYRFAFASLALLPFLFTHRAKFNGKEWGLLLIGTFLGIPLQFLVQFTGLSLTTVSHASLMVGTMPVILALGAVAFAHERLRVLGWICLIISTLGAGLIALGARNHVEGGPTISGDLLVVVSLIIALGWILLNKKLLESHSAMTVTSYGVIAGTLMLALVVPPMYGMPPVHHISLKAWGALAASGVLCTSATTLTWNWGMTKVPASQAGILLNMEPLMGSLLGVLVLHETLGLPAYIGGLMILVAAVTLTTLHGEATVTDPAIV